MDNITTLTPNYIGLTMPDGALPIDATGDAVYFMLGGKCRHIDFTTGFTYTIIGYANEIGEEQAKQLVDNDREVMIVDDKAAKILYPNFLNQSLYCSTALESLSTLLQSKDLTGNVLIIKKEK